jgi:Zinc dependent phospholipase C
MCGFFCKKKSYKVIQAISYDFSSTTFQRTMPKELTHWLVAQATMRECGIPQQHNDLVQLGAIFPDAPYYTLGKQRSRALQLADRLHGASGEDTFSMVQDCIEILRAIPRESSLASSLRAFLLGAITHLCTDAVFHPFVYFASGNFHINSNLAWRNHRALESALDLAFCQAFATKPYSFSLGAYLHSSEPALERILTSIPAFAPFRNAILDGYRTITVVRKLGSNTPLRWLLDRVESRLPMSVQFYTALRYTSSKELSIDVLQDFQHPVTGEHCQTSLRAMFDTAVQESVRVWNEVERCLANDTNFCERGKSLEVGLVGVASAEMRYFAETHP